MRCLAAFLFASIGWCAGAEVPACRLVEGDRIFAKDLAAAVPEFRAVAPETLLAPAPIPGSQRSFHATELQNLARRYSITLASAPEVCFEWAMQPLDRALALQAMREALNSQSLNSDDAQIEIADMITAKVPPGKLEFPLSRLGAPTAQDSHSPVLWRGDLIYGDNHRFAVWARVTISTPCQKVLASATLRAGQPIDPQQLRVVSGTCFSGSKDTLSIDRAAGRIPLRTVSSGSELQAANLVEAFDVTRGETVRVEVLSGGAKLVLNVKALTDGRNGDAIQVRNPDSNRTFQARVTGKGTAVVMAGPKGS